MLIQIQILLPVVAGGVLRCQPVIKCALEERLGIFQRMGVGTVWYVDACSNIVLY